MNDSRLLNRLSSRKKRREPIEMDMTPLVDVVFLLLIFFMLTASFAMQKSIEIPPSELDNAASPTPSQQELEEDANNIVVRIEADDTIWIEDEKMPTRQALLRSIRQIQDSVQALQKPNTLIVIADAESLHETVVSVLDVGNALRIPNIRLATKDHSETD